MGNGLLLVQFCLEGSVFVKDCLCVTDALGIQPGSQSLIADAKVVLEKDAHVCEKL